MTFTFERDFVRMRGRRTKVEGAVEITKARKNVWEAQQKLISRTDQAG